MRQVPRVDGPTLRDIRTRAGLTQVDIAEMLEVNRSTVSNMEAGRQRISTHHVRRLVSALPKWAAEFLRDGQAPLPDIDNASLAIEELTIAYVFETSLSPSEIIQIRRVRALRAGVARYTLGLVRSDGGAFKQDTKVLWGGFLENARAGDSEWTSVEFGRALRRGEIHEIATRSWVERDAKPDTEIWLRVTVPTARASVHVAFHGERGARRAWSSVVEKDYHSETASVPIGLDSGITFVVENPVPGRTYALSWEW